MSLYCKPDLSVQEAFINQLFIPQWLLIAIVLSKHHFQSPKQTRVIKPRVSGSLANLTSAQVDIGQRCAGKDTVLSTSDSKNNGNGEVA